MAEGKLLCFSDLASLMRLTERIQSSPDIRGLLGEKPLQRTRLVITEKEIAVLTKAEDLRLQDQKEFGRIVKPMLAELQKGLSG